MCVAIVAILLAIVLPQISRIRRTRHEVTTLSNIRSIAASVVAYAGDSRGLPPAVLPEVLGTHGVDTPESRSTPSGTVAGFWFDNTKFYTRAIEPPIGFAALRIGGARPAQSAIDTVLQTCDFHLSDSYYASPEYWQFFSTQSKEMLRLQPLDMTTFPSEKTLLSFVLNSDSFDEQSARQVREWVRWPRGWADGSAEWIAPEQLLAGIPNTRSHSGSVTWSMIPRGVTPQGGITGRDRRVGP